MDFVKNWVCRRAVLLTLCASFAPVCGLNAQDRSSTTAVVRDEMVDRVAIERLVIEYYYLLDHGRASEIPALFTSDAVFDNPNLGLRAVGHAAIRAYFAQRATELRTTRHISTNLRLVFETPDRASGTRTILYFRGDGGTPPFPAEPGSVGEYREVFQRGKDGRWRFAFRQSELLFADPRAEP